VAELVLVVDQLARGDAEVEGEKGHGHAENAVAESSEALDALADNLFLRGRDKAKSWRVTFYLRRRICKRGQGRLT
jgi:hypothetical protein